MQWELGRAELGVRCRIGAYWKAPSPRPRPRKQRGGEGEQLGVAIFPIWEEKFGRVVR
jgi:hypothetical protein